MSDAADKKPSVVFFGSGPVAAKSLELLSKHANIEAVITKPSTTKEMAAAFGEAPQFSVSNKKELDTLLQEQTFTSRVGVLIDFGIIVSQAVIDSFEMGIVNSHFSLLPEWRGADPITFSLLSGQELTGVSLMLLVPAMDEGPILSWGEQPISPKDTGASLTHKLILLSDGLLKVELTRYLKGGAKLGDQMHIASKYGISGPSYSRKLTKADGTIDWTKSAEQIEREIRAYKEWPKSRTTLGDIDVIITSAHAVPTSGESPGTYEILSEEKLLIVYCGEGYLCIDTLKPAGKSDMTSAAFLAGYKNRLS